MATIIAGTNLVDFVADDLELSDGRRKSIYQPSERIEAVDILDQLDYLFNTSIDAFRREGGGSPSSDVVDSGSFHEIRLDTRISYDSTIGPAYNTTIISSMSRAEQRRAWSSRGRLTFTVKKELLTRQDQKYLEGFFRARKGKAYGFRVRYMNCHIAVDQPINFTTTDGGFRTAQLYFTFSDDINPESIPIYKPVLAANINNSPTSDLYAPDISIKRDGVDFLPESGWSLNRNTGIVTFTENQNGHNFTWSGDFDFPVRFDVDSALFNRQALDIHNWNDITMLELLYINE